MCRIGSTARQRLSRERGPDLGRATAVLLALKGAAVVVVGIDEEAGRQTVPLVASRGPGTTIAAGGVSEQMAADMMVEQALSEFDRVDVLASNAGTAQRPLPGESWDVPKEQWDRPVRVTFVVSISARAPQFLPCGRAAAGRSSAWRPSRHR
jgi:NAD(P)-dependent dehydrogenase (short-subunit alcohol dehydrogenase family)